MPKYTSLAGSYTGMQKTSQSENHVMFCSLCCTVASKLRCYAGKDPAADKPLPVQEVPTGDQPEVQQVCAAYSYNCTADEAGCTPGENLLSWKYAPMSATEYDALKTNATRGGSAYGNVTCCSKDLCNLPLNSSQSEPQRGNGKDTGWESREL